MTIEETICAHLKADPGLAAHIGERLYPGEVPPHDAPPPWVYYLVTDSEPRAELDSSGEFEGTVAFDVLAATYAEASAIELILYSLLHGMRGGQVGLSLWDGSTQEITAEGYHREVRFKVWGSQVAIVPLVLGLPRITITAEGAFLDGVRLLTAEDLAGFAVGNTLIVDAVNGDDETAVSGRANLPYQTPDAAMAGWAAGGLIRVGPGTYEGPLGDQPPGVTYWFDPGASITNTIPGPEGDKVWLFLAAGTYRVYGRGSFTNLNSVAVSAGSTPGVDWLVEAELISSDVSSYPAVSVVGGTGVVRGARVIAPGADLATVYATDGSLVFDRCTIEAPDSGTVPCVAVEGVAAVTLRNCKLVGLPFQNGSIVTVEGTLTLDTAPDPSVTLTGGTVVTPAGSILLHRAEPADADLGAGQLVLWYDGTPAAARLMVKAKDTGGTVVTGEVALT